MSQDPNHEARELTKKILNRIATDPHFRQELLEHPKKTLEHSEFAADAKRLAPGKVNPNMMCRSDDSCWIISCVVTV